MIELNLPTLLTFLRKNGYEAELQKETNQIYMILKMEEREYPFFFRIFDDAYQLQMMLFIPSHLKTQANFLEGSTDLSMDSNNEKVVADVARMLHLLNKELDIPGFGMDENAGVVFYRIVLPAVDKKLDQTLILNYIKGAEQVCKLFAIPIEAVSTGQATLDDILNKAKDQSN